MRATFRHLVAVLLLTAQASSAFGREDPPPAEWIPLAPKTATATNGVTLRILDDKSVVAEGVNPPNTAYDLFFETNELEIQAIRIECMTFDSLPGGGPGRAFNGNIVLSEVTADVEAIGLFGGPEKLPFREAASDHSQNPAQDAGTVIDGDVSPENGWCPEGQTYHDNALLILVPKKPFGAKAGTALHLQLNFASRWEQHTAGRVRVSITRETNLDRVRPGKRAPPNEAIDRSFERGVKYLLSLQQPDGSWLGPDWPMYPVGMTALGAYTLMHCGLRPSHPAVKAALAYITTRDAIRTYDMGCALMAFKEAGEPYPKEKIKLYTKRLIEAMQSGSNSNPNLWGYPNGYGFPNDKTPHFDLSNSQYALLGLRAAVHCGEKVSLQIFERVAKDLLEMQGDYGSFVYKPNAGHNPSASMCVGGMTCLLVCREQLATNKAFESISRRIEIGLVKSEDWLRGNWSFDENLEVPRVKQPNHRWDYYYIYGLERVGSIWGKRMLAGHDWYSEGAAALLKKQGENGSWGTEYGESDSNTCFALLFATRASSATGSKIRHNAVAGDAKSAFSIYANRENPLVAWVGEMNDAVKGRLESGEKIAAVDWLLNGARVGTVPLPIGGNPLLERFTLQHSLTLNGKFDLMARMRFVDAAGKESGEEKSNLLTQYVDFVEESRHREAVRDAGKNLVQNSAGAAVASTEWSGDYAAARGVDGRMGSSWLSKNDDPNPTLRLSFKRPPTATAFKMTQAQAYAVESNDWSRPKEIEFQLNGNKPQKFFLLDDPRIKQRIPFKAVAVKQVRVTVKSVYSGYGQDRACGFKEVELYGVEPPEASEEVDAFTSMTTVIQPGLELPNSWRYVLLDPGVDFTRPDYSAAAWSVGDTPFGGAGTDKNSTEWPTPSLWLRREFDAPAKDATYAFELLVDDKAEIYVNGTFVGGVDSYTHNKYRGLTIPKGIVVPGKNTIAIKASDTGGARRFDVGLYRFE